MKELLKEAWKAKAKKADRMASKKLAPPEILSFDDWQFERRAKKQGEDYSHQADELSDESYSTSDEVTNPTVIFARQMIFSFEDWQLKRPDMGHVRDRHLRTPMRVEDIFNSGSIHYEE